MKQKRNFYRLLLGVTTSLLFISCSTGNKVVSSFGKRKYTKGVYFNKHSAPAIASNAGNTLSTPTINKASTTTGQIAEQVIKNSVPKSDKQVSEKHLTINRLLPRVLAFKDVFRNNNPVAIVPADTSHTEITSTDYRKYNEEAIGGLACGVAMLCLCWTGFGLLLAIPGFFLSKWGTQSQKFHTLAVIGLIINLLGVIVLLFIVSYELLLKANGN